LFLCAALLPLALVTASAAHDDGRPLPLRGVALEQKLGQRVPLELEFLDENGSRTRLGDYFGKRPVILNFVYYGCEDLCPLLTIGLIRALRGLNFEAGKEYAVLTVSFDPKDTPQLAAAQKARAVERYARPGAAQGWHFLTGAKAEILSLTQAIGFSFNADEINARYGHAAGIVILTPEGSIARYFYGIEFSPRDLRLGLVEASAGRIGSPIDQLLLFCYHYDPAVGKYGLLITNVVRAAGIVTVASLALWIFAMLRADRRQRPDVSAWG
jgi:protein SCO1/2